MRATAATSTKAGAWLDRFFDAYYRHLPVNATFIGVHEHDHRLPDLSEAGAGDSLADVESLLAEPLGIQARGVEALDLRLARGFLRSRRWELTGSHFHRGNPSFYTGEAAFGLLSLFLGHGGPMAPRIEAACRRLNGIGALLAQARDNVRQAPPDWTRRAIRECRGILELVGEGIDALSAELGLAENTLRGPADAAGRAAAEHLGWLESELLTRPREDVAAGEEALELYLRDGHFLTGSIDEIVAYAQEEMASTRVWLEEHAGDFGASTVRGTLAELAEHHPTLEEYLPRYREIWEEVRALALEEELLTWPDFPIRYRPRPAWVRKAAPHLYFLYYRSPAAFNRPPIHDSLVTPIDETLPPREREERLRAHDDSVIKLNHVVHHGGIGHHVQNWHAFRADSRVGRVAAVDCASRIAMTCGGTMAEGWACYATDLVAELGGLTSLEAFAQRHSRLRMCARAVVDLELHRGAMSLDEAETYYVERADMSPAAARSEAVKNSMFPGCAVMYLTGTDAIHDLRARMAALQGDDFVLRDFHDTFLCHGSVPVTLIADEMIRRAEAGTATHAG